MLFFFLTSGLFLGWSLGANDAANVFGTAVGSKMIRFKTAAMISSIFVVIGAVVGGSGTTHTLGTLGSVNAIAGSFMVALAAAFTVYFMTKLSIPVSTSQAIVGAIIGWNFFSGAFTNTDTLTKIVLTWVLCPMLAAGFAILLYYVLKIYLSRAKIHLLRQDFYTRMGLVVVGAFGSYSLGANNIANVMGVFVPARPFKPIHLFNSFSLSGAQILFLIGGLAIAVGIYTYSMNVMKTVGSGLFRLSPETALIVVLSQALVLFLFSSENLEAWLISHKLPAIPLVPVSSSQAVVGAIMGIGVIKGSRNLQYKKLGNIAGGWIATPVIAGLIAFIGLFILQNVFTQDVKKTVEYRITDKVISRLDYEDIQTAAVVSLKNESYYSFANLISALKKKGEFSREEIGKIVTLSFVDPVKVPDNLTANNDLLRTFLNEAQFQALQTLTGQHYIHKWELYEDLCRLTPDWCKKNTSRQNIIFNRDIDKKLNSLYEIFKQINEVS